MAKQLFISICIPAYKHVDFLRRLLDSIIGQTFTDFEVIVTDDSPDKEVKNLCLEYMHRLPLVYYRNEKPLGTPENWNEAIRKAKGNWIKLMHDDDWFAEKDSLAKFAEAVRNYPHSTFFFSAYRNTYLETNQIKDIFIPFFRYQALRQDPASLISSNVIGPPSCVLFSADQAIIFDNQLKWLVDIDFYIRYLSRTKAVYINEVLVCVGISGSQVTKETFRNPQIEIPENLLVLKKTGNGQLKHILVFDAWWRLLRNLRIRDSQQIKSYSQADPIPSRILAVIRFQRKIPFAVLGVGIFSKCLMILCYFSTYFSKDTE